MFSKHPKLCIRSLKYWANFEELQLILKGRKCSLYIWRIFTMFDLCNFTISWVCQFIPSGSWKVFVIMGFGGTVFLDSVINVICYIYICVFRYFSRVFGFLANLYKCNPFLFGVVICEFLFCFVWVLEISMVGIII